MLQRDGEMMVEMKVLWMVVMMMILMKSGAMAMTMATISLLFPSRFLPAGELFSLWCFLPRRGSGVYL
jgi:hypothetical protein